MQTAEEIMNKHFKEGAKYGYSIKESVNDKLDFYAMDLNTERIKTYTALSERYNLDISSIRDIFDAGLNFAAGKYESIFSASNQENNEGWISIEDKLTIKLNYCVEVDRGGIGEESMVLHYSFDKEPTRDEILKLIESEDCGYDDDYCKFDYYLINPPKEK